MAREVFYFINIFAILVSIFGFTMRKLDGVVVVPLDWSELRPAYFGANSAGLRTSGSLHARIHSYHHYYYSNDVSGLYGDLTDIYLQHQFSSRLPQHTASVFGVSNSLRSSAGLHASGHSLRGTRHTGLIWFLPPICTTFP